MDTKLGILAHHDKMQLQDKGIYLKAIFLELCPFLSKILSKMMALDRQALVPHAVLLLDISLYLIIYERDFIFKCIVV